MLLSQCPRYVPSLPSSFLQPASANIGLLLCPARSHAAASCVPPACSRAETEIVQTADPDEAFLDTDVCILVGSMPRREGMLRKDLLKANAMIFKLQGQALDRVAKKSVKVLVVGNPANTNALIASRFAPSIPARQFTSLTQLDQVSTPCASPHVCP